MSNKKILNLWKNHFKDHGITEEIQFRYLSYIERILSSNVPIIFDFTHLAMLLSRTEVYLASVVNSTESHYREFQIRKRSGGLRTISAPYPALLEMQRWILSNILWNVPYSPYSHGFTKKKSIITNAHIHKNQNNILKIDIKDFFPSININRIISIFKYLGYPTNISFYLSSICCLDSSLPQGAPTSPYLSNLVCRRLDKRLITLCKGFKIRYTRYADDLTFSGDNIPIKFADYITEICEDEGFSINPEKNRLYKKNRKKIVTGIDVSNEELKIPREYKRKLKQELYYVFKFGLDSHVSKKRINKPNYLMVLLGKVNYWLSVENENHNAKEAKDKLVAMIKQ